MICYISAQKSFAESTRGAFSKAPLVILFRDAFLFPIAVEFDQNRIPSDTLDIAPRDGYAVFGRKRGENAVAGEYYRAYLSAEGVELDIGYTPEQTAVANVDDLFTAELRKARYRRN